MILEEPKIYIENYNPIKIMKNIERAMRTCYRSEGNITEDSYKKLINMAISSGHDSVLEHEKITVRLRCSINTYKDLTRHRFASFSIESTRWCNYSKNRFDNQLHFINPIYIQESKQKEIWEECMEDIELAYMNGANAGMLPDQLRTMLPHSIAADVTITCNIREWRHILKLRTTKQVHPEIRQLLIPLLLKFKKDMPELFNDIEYDEEFPHNWFAEIQSLED